jgi:hypothetical protein
MAEFMCTFDKEICQYLSYCLIYKAYLMLLSFFIQRKNLDSEDGNMISIMNERSVRLVRR